MFPTLEVRWFLRGSPPPEVASWFQQAGHRPAEQAPRVDYYLRLQDGEAIGIKLREGRIEIKKRTRQLGAVHFHEQVTGKIEGWIKWSFALAQDEASLLRTVLAAPSWVCVHKERSLRRYRLASTGEMAASPVEVWPDRGCDIELTCIRVEEEAWWSLSFEAFGRKETLQEGLALVAAYTLRAGAPLPLVARDSCGYPEWLEKTRH